MAARGKGKGSKGGPGGFVLSIVALFVIAGAIFAFAKANNINSVSGLIDWSRTASAKFKECLEPDIQFWSCSFDFGSGSGSGSEGGSDNGTDPGTDEGTAPAEPEAPSALLQKLTALPVGEPQKVDYNRDEWKHWIGDRCNDTRQQVLKEQAVSFKLDGEGCKVASGEWIDPYTGKTFTDPSKLDIDHVYALGAAAKNGGNGWDAATKQAFANDKIHLLAVSASANRSKSDRNPAEWWPENTAYSCQFATKYVDVATKYGLQFSKADVAALEKGLKTCG